MPKSIKLHSTHVCLAALTLAGSLSVGTVVQARESYRLGITYGPATVPGIRSDPVQGWRGPWRVVSSRPAASSMTLDKPAPANGCEATQGGFRSLSGRDAGTCY